MATAKSSRAKSKKVRKSKAAPAKKKKLATKKKPATKKTVAKKKPAARPKRKPSTQVSKARAATNRKARARAQEVAKKKSASGVLGVSPAYLKAMSLYEKAQGLLQKRDFPKAAELFQRLIQDHADAHDLADRARVYINLCRQQTAAAAKLEGFDDHYYQGVYLTNRGEYGEAIDLFEKALTFRPNSGKVHFSLAAAYAQMEDRQKAIDCLRRAVELDESNRFLARQDPDLEPLRGHPVFEELVGLDEGSSGE